MPIDQANVPPAILETLPPCKDCDVEAIVIYDGPQTESGHLVVEIGMDGSVKFGPGFKGDDAARIFWEQLGRSFPYKCKP